MAALKSMLHGATMRAPAPSSRSRFSAEGSLVALKAKNQAQPGGARQCRMEVSVVDAVKRLARQP